MFPRTEEGQHPTADGRKHGQMEKGRMEPLAREGSVSSEIPALNRANLQALMNETRKQNVKSPESF